MSVFKAYDIRGIYNNEFNKEDVYRIGFYLPKLLKADKVLVGYDCRLSSEEIFNYLTKGITDSGADVYNIGLSTTPMVYFATANYKFDASVQITASHNPKEYNGLKISRTGALPVGYDTGLAELEGLIKNDILIDSPKGKIINFGVKEDYIKFLKEALDDISSLNISFDCSNGMSSLLVKDIFGLKQNYINNTLDGNFPNHEPNPLEEKNVEQLKKSVLMNKSDIGIIYDGDADRVVFTDEAGRFIPPDIMIGVLGSYYLEKEKGNVLHDIRTSKSVTDYIKKLGGDTYMWKVGHAFAKLKLREINGIFGGELAGHYYFRDFFNCDSGIYASIIILNVLCKLKKKGVKLSAFIDSIITYKNSGELNFKIEDKSNAMEELKRVTMSEEHSTLFYDFDGYRIEFENWWFNVRKSNTEPYLRLVVEANCEEMLKDKLSKLNEILKKYTN